MVEFSETRQPPTESLRKARNKRQIITDALWIALNREIDIKMTDPENPGEIKTVRSKRINVLADQIVLKAINGDVPAFNAVADRMEGKPVQRAEIAGADGEDLNMTITFVRPEPREDD